MKFTQEEIKKVVLTGIFAIGGLYVYFNMLLGPLNLKEKRAGLAAADLEPKIRDAQREIQRASDVAAKLPWAEEVMAEARSLIPDGAPVAWFPPRIIARFERYNIKGVTVRLLKEEGEAALPGYKRISWNVALPKFALADLGFALAGIENEEPLIQVTGLSIDAGPETEPEFQSGAINLRTVVRQ